MNRAVVIFSLLCLGCQSRRAKSTSDPNAASATDATSATTPRTLIAAGQDLGAAGGERDSDEWAAAELTRIAARVRAEMQRDPTAAPSAAINRTIFDVLGFQREVDDQDTRYVLLPSVLRLRRGSCVGLGVMYVALGALLDVPIRGVMVPGHFYVRIDESGRARNTELLRRGEEMPAAWYVDRYPIAGGSAPAYARPLTTTEVVGVIEYNVGQQWKRLGRLDDARRAYGQASAHFPMFAEAAASLGATLHLLGALDQAAAAYQAAARAYPDLPGLKANISLLGQERGKTGTETGTDSGASLTQPVRRVAPSRTCHIARRKIDPRKPGPCVSSRCRITGSPARWFSGAERGGPTGKGTEPSARRRQGFKSIHEVADQRDRRLGTRPARNVGGRSAGLVGGRCRGR